MRVILIVIDFLLIYLYMFSRGKYEEQVSRITSQEYPLKKTLPMGLYLMEQTQYTYCTPYERKILLKIGSCYDSKETMSFLKIHWAYKVTCTLVGLFVLSFIGAIYGKCELLFFCFFGIVLLSLFFLPDYELTKKLNKRRIEIQYEFPDFLNKLILLINAGMTVPRAWEKIVKDNKKSSLMRSELERTDTEIRAGVPLYQAYENFARRCAVPEVSQFIAVLLQNMKRGGYELIPLLQRQAQGCWETRKSIARRKGEEASTKLLFPMMLMLIAILLIVIAPALLAMKGL